MRLVRAMVVLAGAVLALGCGGGDSKDGNATNGGGGAGGGGAGGGGGSLDCGKFCQKAMACGQDVGTEAECLDVCKKTKQIVVSQCGDNVATCLDKECNQFEACFSQVMANGPTDVGPVAEAICAKLETCSNGQMPKEACLAQLGSSLDQAKCFTKEAVDAMASCAESASCDDFQGTYGACLEEKLGVDLSS